MMKKANFTIHNVFSPLKQLGSVALLMSLMLLFANMANAQISGVTVTANTSQIPAGVPTPVNISIGFVTNGGEYADNITLSMPAGCTMTMATVPSAGTDVSVNPPAAGVVQTGGGTNTLSFGYIPGASTQPGLGFGYQWGAYGPSRTVVANVMITIPASAVAGNTFPVNASVVGDGFITNLAPPAPVAAAAAAVIGVQSCLLAVPANVTVNALLNQTAATVTLPLATFSGPCMGIQTLYSQDFSSFTAGNLVPPSGGGMTLATFTLPYALNGPNTAYTPAGGNTGILYQILAGAGLGTAYDPSFVGNRLKMNDGDGANQMTPGGMATATTPAIAIPAGATNVKLSYSYRNRLDAGDFFVDVSLNGGAFATIQTQLLAGTGVFNYNVPAGTTSMLVRFRYSDESAWNWSADVDNIKVTADAPPTIANSFNGGGANASGLYPLGTTLITYNVGATTAQTSVTVLDTQVPTLNIPGDAGLVVNGPTGPVAPTGGIGTVANPYTYNVTLGAGQCAANITYSTPTLTDNVPQPPAGATIPSVVPAQTAANLALIMPTFPTPPVASFPAVAPNVPTPLGIIAGAVATIFPFGLADDGVLFGFRSSVAQPLGVKAVTNLFFNAAGSAVAGVVDPPASILVYTRTDSDNPNLFTASTAGWSGPFKCTLIHGGRIVTGVVISTPGSGYSTPPTVTFTGGNPVVPATGFATVNPITGAVTGITITNRGAGYQSAPTITLSAPTAGGTCSVGGALVQAIATATINAVTDQRAATYAFPTTQFVTPLGAMSFALAVDPTAIPLKIPLYQAGAATMNSANAAGTILNGLGMGGLLNGGAVFTPRSLKCGLVFGQSTLQNLTPQYPQSGFLAAAGAPNTVQWKGTDISNNMTTEAFTINVAPSAATTTTLACNESVNITMNAACNATVSAEQLLKGGPYACLGSYKTEVYNGTNLIGTTTFDPAKNCYGFNGTALSNFVGQTLIAKVYDVTNPNNSCWGNITLEDKTAPTIVCPGDLVINDCSLDINSVATVKSSIPFASTNAAFTSFGAANLDIPIPVTNLPATSVVEDLKVRVQFGTNDWLSEIAIELVTPTGTVIALKPSGGGGCNSTSTVAAGVPTLTYTFDATSPNGPFIMGSACASYAAWNNSTVKPAGSFAPALGLPVNGNWIVRFRDVAAPNTNTIPANAISLIITTTVPLAGATATDACAGVITPTVTVQQLNLPCGNPLIKQIKRVYKATDNFGNTATCVQNINFPRPTLASTTFPADANLNCDYDNLKTGTGTYPGVSDVAVKGGGLPVAFGQNTNIKQGATNIAVPNPFGGNLANIVTNVRLNIGVTAPNINDLRMSLIHPNGTTIRLMNKQGSTACVGGNLSYSFFDAAPNAPILPATLCAGSGSGSYKPIDDLSVLINTNDVGTWSILVEDNTGNTLDDNILTLVQLVLSTQNNSTGAVNTTTWVPLNYGILFTAPELPIPFGSWLPAAPVTVNAISSVVTIPPNVGTVLKLKTTLTFKAPKLGDMRATLKYPTIINPIELFNKQAILPAVSPSCTGTMAGDVYTYVFEDSAPGAPITAATTCANSVSGSYKPITPLATFNGLPAGGTWLIELFDNAGNPLTNDDTFISAVLEITTVSPLSNSIQDIAAAQIPTSLNLPKGYAGPYFDANGNPHPNVTGRPSGAGCAGLVTDYTDTRIDNICGTGLGYAVLRTWKVYDACAGALTTRAQNIAVKDITPPAVDGASLPTATERTWWVYTTSPTTCTGKVTMRKPVVADNCSPANKLTYSAELFHELPNPPQLSSGVPNLARPVGFPVSGDAMSFEDVPMSENKINPNSGLPYPQPFVAVISITDACGNVTRVNARFVVMDRTAPSMVCQDIIKVSLSQDGYATLTGLELDKGSYDNCTTISKFEVRRMAPISNCTARDINKDGDYEDYLQEANSNASYPVVETYYTTEKVPPFGGTHVVRSPIASLVRAGALELNDAFSNGILSRRILKSSSWYNLNLTEYPIVPDPATFPTLILTGPNTVSFEGASFFITFDVANAITSITPISIMIGGSEFGLRVISQYSEDPDLSDIYGDFNKNGDPSDDDYYEYNYDNFFHEDVKFCCEDVGDTIMVALRAWDSSIFKHASNNNNVNHPNYRIGYPASLGVRGNVNICMTRIIVEDKVDPKISVQDTAVICGNNVTASAWLDANGPVKGTANSNMSDNSVFSNKSAVALDSGAVATIKIPVTGLKKVKDLNVGLQFYHTYLGNLIATVTSPSGKSAILFANPVDATSSLPYESPAIKSAANAFKLRFDDEPMLAPTVVSLSANGGYLQTIPGVPNPILTSSLNKLNGAYLATDALSIFDNEDPNGEWTITVEPADPFVNGTGAILASGAQLLIKADRNTMPQGFYYDNCGDATVTYTDNGSIDNCGKGIVNRVYTVTDCAGRKATDTQSYTSVNRSAYTVLFPADVNLTCNDNSKNNLTPQGTTNVNSTTIPGSPVINTIGGTCPLVGIEYTDDTLTISNGGVNLDGTCFKIVRTWKILNWCQGLNLNADKVQRFNPAACADLETRTFVNIDYAAWAGSGLTPAQINAALKECSAVVYDEDGYMEYVQVITVTDNMAPSITKGNIIQAEIGKECNVNVTVNAPTATDCTGKIATYYEIYNTSNVKVAGPTSTFPSTVKFGGTGNTAFGTYTVRWFASDNCGNLSSVDEVVVVKDAKKPTPICFNGLSVDIMPTTGNVMVSCSLFDAGSYDNCQLDGCYIQVPAPGAGADITKLVIDATANGMTDKSTPSKLAKNVVFNCTGPQTVALWVKDAAGNWDYCETYIEVQNNMGAPGVLACPSTPISGAKIAAAIATETGKDVENVMVKLSGAASYQKPTTINGKTEFYGLGKTSSYTVKPELDKNPLNGVSTLDLVLMSKHILGVQPLNSAYQMIAADVNKSGTVSTADIVELRKMILAIQSNFTKNTSWRFVDKSYQFPTNPLSAAFPESKQFNGLTNDIENAPFVAVKIGDINGNAQTNGQAVGRGTVGTFFFNAEEQIFNAGQEVRATFKANEIANILGYQFTMNYNNSALDLITIDGNTENFGVVENGTITASWNGSAQADEQLFTLVFKAKKAGRLSELLNINSKLTTAEAYTKNAELLNVAINYNNATSKMELYQNQPNPFAGRTVIGFNLPKAENAKMTIYDMTGRVLKVIEKDFAKGYNEVTIEDINATGVVKYTLSTATATATKSMIILE